MKQPSTPVFRVPPKPQEQETFGRGRRDSSGAEENIDWELGKDIEASTAGWRACW